MDHNGKKGREKRTLRLRAAALAAALLLLVSGCGSSAEKSTAQPVQTLPSVTVDLTQDADTGTASEQETTVPEPGTTESEPQTEDESGNETAAGQTRGTEETADESDRVAVFRFAGDFTQAEEGGEGVPMSIMQVLDGTYGGDITQVFSDDLLALMRDADVFMLNNEFTYSRRGKPLAGKDWTFRADPKRVENLNKLGVDCVGLANNHAFDWGEDALLDTIETLDGAGIPHVGAGENLEAAKKPVYFEVKGRTFSVVAATAVEKEWEPEYGLTRAATADSAGVLRTTDPAETLDAIRTAKANSDFCFVFVHWGIEMQTEPDEEQKQLAWQYIEAGADAVIGAHPHILQGIEFMNGKPVIYSMGNFWFNSKERATCLFEVAVDCDTLAATVKFHPCLQRDCRTVLVTKKESREAAIEAERQLSFGVNIAYDGTVEEE